jgi:large subunit ribosomal protein L18
MRKYKSAADRRAQRNRRKLRATSNGTARLSVFKSGQHIYGQIIDDIKGITIVSSSTLDPKVKEVLGKKSKNLTAASLVGKMLGEKALEKGLSKVVFDRGPYPYHGKVKAIADAAREAGLQF